MASAATSITSPVPLASTTGARPVDTFMPRRAFAAALALALSAIAAPASMQAGLGVMAQSSSDTCESTSGVLTTECGGLCGDYRACVTHDSSEACSSCVASDGGDCTVKCVENYYPGLFKFGVSFGSSYQSDQEVADRATDSDYDAEVEAVNDPSSEFVVSNDVVTAVGTLELDPDIYRVVISGGSTSATRYLKGKVAHLDFDSDLISNLEGVGDVYLTSLDLTDVVETLSAMVPSNITSLDLSNDLLTEFPSQFSASPIIIMRLEGNYMTTVEAIDGFDKLTELHLDDNNLESFEAVFSALETLTMTSNSFTAMPASLSQLESLNYLYLDENAITRVESADSADSLINLYLNNNSVEVFEAYYPSLQSLYLSGSNLDTIPAVIYNHTELNTLNIDNNASPLSANFTKEQITFLEQLSLHISGTNFTSVEGCESVHKLANTTNVCIVTADTVEDKRPKTSAPSTDSNSDTSNATNATKSISHTTAIAGGVGGGVAVVLVVVAIVWWYRRQHPSHKAQGGSGYVSVWHDPELLAIQLKSDDIQDVRKIGGGTYGDVWLVKYKGSRMLASKRLRKDDVTREHTQALVGEIKLVSRFEHPNIVKLVGAAWTVESDLQALFEFMSNGDLRDYLLKASTPRGWNAEKLQIAIGVASGLWYVHSFSPPVVHRDLKSRNVLLSNEIQAQLTDFGVSRFESKNATMTQGVGTSRWLAPEVIAGNSEYNQAADVFSFGVVLSEMDTHELPYDDVRGANGNKLADVAILQMVVTGAIRPRFGDDCPSGVRLLADRCLAMDPADRPTATEAAAMLETARGQLHTTIR